MKSQYPVVNTHNEWDPLEEIIVGTVEGATIPPWEPATPAVVHYDHLLDFYRQNGGQPWPQEMLDAAQKDIDEFVHILEAEGVTVRRPSIYDTGKSFSTPDFEIESSVGALMPRDVLLVIGDQIIEAPMGWRSRYHENHAYKELCKEYFRKGARWVSAPRPQLSDASFKQGFVPPEDRAEIIVCANNFHGRTITIVGFSTEEGSRAGFGPFTPGFKIIPYTIRFAPPLVITKNEVDWALERIEQVFVPMPEPVV